MKVWKVVRELHDGSLVSAWAKESWTKRYSRGHWTRARKLSGGETIAFLYAFRSLYDAQAFVRRMQSPMGPRGRYQIWEAEAVIDRHAPVVAWFQVWDCFWQQPDRSRARYGEPAPPGTVLCKAIKLIRCVDGEAAK